MTGLHYTDTYAGRVFSQSATPLGLALPLYTATSVGGGLPILNPVSSGVLVELIRADFQWASGTAGIGAVGLMAGFCAGIGTATGCSALAATTPVNGYLGAGGGSKVISSNAGTTTVTAGTATAAVNGVPGAGWIRSMGSINLENSTTTPLGTLATGYEFNGTIIVPPGIIIYLACTVASVALYATGIVWKEIPINP